MLSLLKKFFNLFKRKPKSDPKHTPDYTLINKMPTPEEAEEKLKAEQLKKLSETSSIKKTTKSKPKTSKPKTVRKKKVVTPVEKKPTPKKSTKTVKDKKIK